MFWNPILSFKRTQTFISGERSLKWKARSDLKEFLSIKVSSGGAANATGCGNHSSLRLKRIAKQSTWQRYKVTVCSQLILYRSQNTKTQYVSHPRNTSWSLCWFHDFLGWASDFIRCLCWNSTARWWHHHLEIQEEWEVEEKCMLSLDTKVFCFVSGLRKLWDVGPWCTEMLC